MSVQYISFYEVDPIAMPGSMNLGHDWDLGLLTAACERGLRMLPDVSSVFFFRPFFLDNGVRKLGPLKLRPDFTSCWKAFFSLIRPLIDQGRVEGVFLGDELLWNGARPNDIHAATSIIRGSFATVTNGNSLLIYLNEYTKVFTDGMNVEDKPVKPNAEGDPMNVTVAELGVTHVSIDEYGVTEHARSWTRGGFGAGWLMATATAVAADRRWRRIGGGARLR